MRVNGSVQDVQLLRPESLSQVMNFCTRCSKSAKTIQSLFVKAKVGLRKPRIYASWSDLQWRQVYETMVVMALNPDKVIRLMNPQPGQITTKEEPNDLWKTPSKNQEDNTATQFSTMFSKKPPKPASIAC
ncbi:hypothetical protein R6Q59_018820 [Mikania micrantha]